MVRRARESMAATPRPNCCPGMMVSKVVPSALMRSRTACCAPRPSAIIAMTAATPMTMPSIVRNDRILLARSAPRATRRISPISTLPSPAAWRASASGSAGSAATLLALHPWDAAAGHATEAVELLLSTLLKRRGGQNRDLFAFGQARAHLGVVVVGDA